MQPMKRTFRSAIWPLLGLLTVACAAPDGRNLPAAEDFESLSAQFASPILPAALTRGQSDREGNPLKIQESAEDYLEAILAIREAKGTARSIDVATA